MRSALAFHFLEELARDAERIDRGRHPGIAPDLQEDFGDLRLGDAVGERAAQMRAQFMRPIEDADHREVEHAAGLRRQAFAAPDPAPAIFGDEVLQRAIEVVDVFERSIYIGVAENLAADAQSLVVHGLVHTLPPWFGLRVCCLPHRNAASAGMNSFLTLSVCWPSAGTGP